MTNFKKHQINLNKTKITIAIAQISGPLPDGMQVTVTEDFRETWRWKTVKDMDERIEKVCGILDEIAKSSSKPDFVIFPEYSFPVLKALPKLQDKANEYEFVIVGGSDAIKQSDSDEIFNQSPIIIPHADQPLWVTKRIVSQWEEGLIDEPESVENPLLTWEVNKVGYWISTHICLDFRLAADEFKSGGGVFFVTMSSPDVPFFLGKADDLLRLDNGTATVLCNSIGEGTKGQSGLVIVDPQAKPYKAAFELSTNKEQVGIVEVDLQKLSPPKKTPSRHAYPLGKRFIYDLEKRNGKIKFQHLPEDSEERTLKRAVINPSIFNDVLGKKLRMAFLNVPQYTDVEKSVDGKEFEVLAILGKEDIMITHLAADRYDMISDITRAVSWIDNIGDTVTGNNVYEVNEDNFPHFRVDTYYKVLGRPVTDENRKVFSKGKSIPTFQEIEQIFKLGQDWEDENVSQEERTKFLERGWILDVSTVQPGQINAIMTINLKYARAENKAKLLRKFEETVMPILIDDSEVTSIYKGVSPGLGIDYLVRISLKLNEGFQHLYDTIKQIHNLSIKEGLIVDSTTYIVVHGLAKLSLSRAILVTNLPKQAKVYRDRRISPYLDEHESVTLSYQSEEEQLRLISLFRPIDDALERINYLNYTGEDRNVYLRKLVRGIFNKSFDMLKDVHDPLQLAAERLVTKFINEKISDEIFAEIKNKDNKLKSASQRTKKQLSYTEKVIVVKNFAEGYSKNNEVKDLIDLLNPTTSVRNIFMHDRNDEFTIENDVPYLSNLCKFVNGWEKSLNANSSD